MVNATYEDIEEHDVEIAKDFLAFQKFGIGIKEIPPKGRKVEGMDVPDMLMPTTNIAETNLPTDIGHFRLRAYRVDEDVQKLQRNKYIGSEPCVIYSKKYPPFGKSNVPVRAHDQCFTSEVFRSQR